MDYKIENIQKIIRRWLLFFIVSLVISGLTALDTENGIWWLSSITRNSFASDWVAKVLQGIRAAGAEYRFLFYGYDWLAFAHIVIAIAFIGPYKNPVKNKWVLQFGCIAALLVIPFALIAGAVRDIPLWWRLLDCSFGVLALVPLGICYRLTEKLEFIEAQKAEQEKQAAITGKCKYHMLLQNQ